MTRTCEPDGGRECWEKVRQDESPNLRVLCAYMLTQTMCVTVCACAEEHPTASISQGDGALLSGVFVLASFRSEFASYPNLIKADLFLAASFSFYHINTAHGNTPSCLGSIKARGDLSERLL